MNLRSTDPMKGRHALLQVCLMLLSCLGAMAGRAQSCCTPNAAFCLTVDGSTSNTFVHAVPPCAALNVVIGVDWAPGDVVTVDLREATLSNWDPPVTGVTLDAVAGTFTNISATGCSTLDFDIEPCSTTQANTLGGVDDGDGSDGTRRIDITHTSGGAPVNSSSFLYAVSPKLLILNTVFAPHYRGELASRTISIQRVDQGALSGVDMDGMVIELDYSGALTQSLYEHVELRFNGALLGVATDIGGDHFALTLTPGMSTDPAWTGFFSNSGVPLVLEERIRVMDCPLNDNIPIDLSIHCALPTSRECRTIQDVGTVIADRWDPALANIEGWNSLQSSICGGGCTPPAGSFCYGTDVVQFRSRFENQQNAPADRAIFYFESGATPHYSYVDKASIVVTYYPPGGGAPVVFNNLSTSTSPCAGGLAFNEGFQPVFVNLTAPDQCGTLADGFNIGQICLGRIDPDVIFKVEGQYRTCCPDEDEAFARNVFSYSSSQVYYDRACLPLQQVGQWANISIGVNGNPATWIQRTAKCDPPVFDSGPTNLLTPSFGGPEHHEVVYSLRAPTVWYGADRQIVLQVELEPGLYIRRDADNPFEAYCDNADDLAAMSVTLTDNTVLTLANGGLIFLDLTSPACYSTVTCGSVHPACNDIATAQLQIARVAINPTFTALGGGTVVPINAGYLSKLEGALFKIRFRMHCIADDNAPAVGVDPEECYSPCRECDDGCEQAAMVGMTIKMLDRMDKDCAGPEACELLLAEGGKLFQMQCPGCTRQGIHSELYEIHRSTFGYRDATDDGWADSGATAPMTEAEVLANAQGVRMNRAMFTDELKGTLTTKVVLVPPPVYHPSLDQFEQCDGSACFKNLYYENRVKAPDVGTPTTCAESGGFLVKPLTVRVRVDRGGNGSIDHDFTVNVEDPGLLPANMMFSQWNAAQSLEGCSGLPGTACDDGNPNSINDTWSPQCVCAGTLAVDCAGVPGGPAQPGASCNDGDPDTANDVYQEDCSCAGQPSSMIGNFNLFKFDLSPSKIAQVNTNLLGGTTPYPADFGFINNDWVYVTIGYRVACNIGADEDYFDVLNKIYMTIDPDPINAPLAVDPQCGNIGDCAVAPGLACQPGDTPIPCDRIQYYCTFKGGGIGIAGYQLGFQQIAGSTVGFPDLVNDPYACGSGLRCASHVRTDLSLKIGIQGPFLLSGLIPWGRNYFPFEYRNWLRLEHVDLELPPGFYFAPGTYLEETSAWRSSLLLNSQTNRVPFTGITTDADIQMVYDAPGASNPVSNDAPGVLTGADDDFSQFMHMTYRAECDEVPLTTDKILSGLRYAWANPHFCSDPDSNPGSLTCTEGTPDKMQLGPYQFAPQMPPVDITITAADIVGTIPDQPFNIAIRPNNFGSAFCNAWLAWEDVNGTIGSITTTALTPVASCAPPFTAGVFTEGALLPLGCLNNGITTGAALTVTYGCQQLPSNTVRFYLIYSCEAIPGTATLADIQNGVYSTACMRTEDVVIVAQPTTVEPQLVGTDIECGEVTYSYCLRSTDLGRFAFTGVVIPSADVVPGQVEVTYNGSPLTVNAGVGEFTVDADPVAPGEQPLLLPVPSPNEVGCGQASNPGSVLVEIPIGLLCTNPGALEIGFAVTLNCTSSQTDPDGNIVLIEQVEPWSVAAPDPDMVVGTPTELTTCSDNGTLQIELSTLVQPLAGSELFVISQDAALIVVSATGACVLSQNGQGTSSLAMTLDALSIGNPCSITIEYTGGGNCMVGTTPLLTLDWRWSDCGAMECEWAAAEVPIPVKDSDCPITVEVGTSASVCGGPWQVLCGAFDPIGHKPFYINGAGYVWENVGGAFIAYDQNVWTLTGSIKNTGDPNDRYWVQLYLDNPIDGTAWTGQVDPCNVCTNPDPTTWSYYGVSTVPTWESLLVGLGANDGQIADIHAEQDYAFQFGEGASTHSDGLGSSMLFKAVLRDGSGTLSGRMAFYMNCDLSWIDFSPCSGKIDASITGGVAPHTVTLTGPGSSITTVTSSGYVLFEALCNNGTEPPYELTIVDANGCTIVQQGIVLDNGTLPLEAELVYDSKVCAEDEGCAEVVSVSGGTGPYEVHWFWQGVQQGQEPVLLPGAGLCDLPTEEENWVVIEDANECYVTYKYFIQESENKLILVASGTDPDCGESNGMVETEVAGSEGQLTYVWDPPNANVPAITGLGPGTYTVTVTDEVGCAQTATVELEAEEGTLTLTGTAPSCHGGTNGTATIQDLHGTPTILWSNGQTTATATGLSPGTYTVTVTDAGCVSTGSITITDPAAFTASIGYTNPSCPNGPCNGSASANLSGAQGTVTYAWTSNGSPVGGNSANVSNLCGGPVILTATDANGCVATANASLPAATCGPVINNCGSLNNLSRSSGSVSVGVVSGALYYQFNFNTPCGYNRNITTTPGSNVRTLNWSTLPLEDCQTYSVRARAFMDNPAPTPDDYGPWGEWCSMTTNLCATPMQLKAAYIWSPNLVSLTGSVEVNKRNDAYRYQFEFWSVDANNNPLAVVKTVNPPAQGQTDYVHQCNKASVAGAPQLSACTKYKVRVRRSLDCTANWEGTWGPYVLIKTNGTCPPGMALQPGNDLAGSDVRAGLTLFPNPNDGTELNVLLTGIEVYPAEVRIEMLDVLGRVIQTRKLNIEDDILSTVLPLDPALGPGLYTVRTTSGAAVLTSTFVLER